ncbi:hypothetical protein QQX98_007990 [Neonectria punicea]|uniref:Uncharacterized protein n=1 Tax=Neonectria punicea TaxID=979145 RepID=A0ABR1GWR2_9HYPO
MAAATSPSPQSANRHRLFFINRRPLQPSDYFDLKDEANDRSYYMELNDHSKAIGPDVVLHIGSSADGPVVGISHLAIGEHMRIGLGAFEGGDPVQWEDMTRRNLRTSIFSWETRFAWPTQVEDAEKRVLWWKRTRSINVEGVTSAFLLRNWKLVDEDSGKSTLIYKKFSNEDLNRAILLVYYCKLRRTGRISFIKCRKPLVEAYQWPGYADPAFNPGEAQNAPIQAVARYAVNENFLFTRKVQRLKVQMEKEQNE